MERNLESCFQMAQAWECVLLLDEADIFLAARNTQNENRNALVSGIIALIPPIPRYNQDADNHISVSPCTGIL